MLQGVMRFLRGVARCYEVFARFLRGFARWYDHDVLSQHPCIRYNCYNKGEVIYSQGQLPQSFYLMLSGAAQDYHTEEGSCY